MRPLLCVLFAFAASATAQVTFDPSSKNIASVIASSPTGTTFTFSPGVYRNVEIIPRDNQTFIGKPGAVLNGSTLITTFSGPQSTANGPVWSIPNQSQVGYVRGECDPAFPRCGYAQDLFIDDRPLRHVGTRAEVGPGKWFFDVPSKTIYFGSNPVGHKVEFGTTRAALWGRAKNVTFQGFIVEKYAIEGQNGAIGESYNAGPSWTIRNNEVRLNHAIGIALSTGSIASQNYVHDNGQLGIATTESSFAPIANLVIEGNQIEGNNWAGFAVGWQSGGMKICSAVNAVIRNNNVRNNNGPGLWADVDSDNVLFEGNTVMNNLHSGILYEVSSRAIIRNNIVGGNYDPASGWYWGAQIQLQNARGVEVNGNVVEVPADRGNGIIIVSQNRGMQYVVKDNYVHHNTVIFNGPAGASGVAGDYDMANVVLKNRFDFNSYEAADMNLWHWVWDAPKSAMQFGATGQDANGRFAAKLVPLLPTWSMR